MSACYGRLTGNRGEVTRTGSQTSGITATVQTWDGAITIRLQADGTYVITEHSPSNGAPHKFGGAVIAEGAIVGSPADAARPEKTTVAVKEDDHDDGTTTRLRKPEGAPKRRARR